MPTVELTKWDYRLGRKCEICGNVTDNVDKHLCDECVKRLNKLLYESGKMNKEKAIYLLSNYFNWCSDCVNHEHSNNGKNCDDCMCKAVEFAITAIKNDVYGECNGCDYSGSCDNCCRWDKHADCYEK